MTFDDLNLNASLRNALNDLEYVHPTPIQQESFTPILAGRDVLGIAQTGTGKTFAFLLPILRNLKFQKTGHPRVLILVSTRELVLQTVGEIEKLTKYMTVRVKGVYGGTNINTQKLTLIEGADIVVGTPGRTMDLGFSGALNLKSCKQLVIDEVDEMLNLGFRTQLKNIFDLLPKKRQNLLFSATMSPIVEELIDDYFDYLHKIVIAAHGTPLEQIEQKAYDVPNFMTKINLLEKLLREDENMQKVLVFSPTKKLADLLFEKLSSVFPEKIGIVHSNKSQNFRIRNVQNFHKGESQALITTDIMARGLDIYEVTHVVNFEMPDSPTTYMHRIGRTGRADKTGIAISFISEREKGFQFLAEQLMDVEIPIMEMPEDVEVINTLLDHEKPISKGDKRYRKGPNMGLSKGAFQEKLEKNRKVNRAQEKRIARLREKRSARRKKKG